MNEMLSLSPVELAFYRQAWELELEYTTKYIAAILGGEKPDGQ